MILTNNHMSVLELVNKTVQACGDCDFFELSGRNCDRKGKIIANWGVCRRVSQHTKKTRDTQQKAAFVWDYETCGGFKQKKRRKQE